MNKQNILNITMETQLRQTVKNNIKLDKVYTCSSIAPNIGTSHVSFPVFFIKSGGELYRMSDLSKLINRILECARY